MSTVADPLASGREAVARHAWAEAFELLWAADAAGVELDARDLEALGEAGWWVARLDECIAARERAFAAYLEAGEAGRAAIVAGELAKSYFQKGSPSIGSAWVKRAERALEGEPDCAERGWIHRLRSVIALEGTGDYEKALEEARRALELATRFHDAELMAVALHDEGRALVMLGRVEEGMTLIDEATAPAIAGELSPLNTALIYCNTITACKELADYRRAGDWSDAAKRWCERQAIAGFPGMCRVYRASVLAVRGEWPEAEIEARRACEELPAFNRSYAAEAFYELGEIRLRAGDTAGAQEAFEQAHELGRDPQPGLARLRLAEGNLDGARRCLEQALDDETQELHRARLLAAGVDIALATGDGAAARGAADEFTTIAARYGSDALEAGAAAAAAKVALADGDVRVGLRGARRALKLWQAVGAPYEAAHARFVVADALLAQGDEEDAALELQAAVSAFDRLGAVRDARAARERLAAAARTAARDPRATRTFMFTDVVGSTNLVEVIGDEAWGDLVRWHDETLRSLFAAHGGEEVDHAGDGFFVAFADPASAVECAVAIQRKLTEHRRQHGFAPQVRIGLHETEASRHGAAYKGLGVHEAARIAALAEGGEIVTSRETAEQTRFPSSDARTVTLKGIDRPVEIVSIVWR